jgi:hypothetical protein
MSDGSASTRAGDRGNFRSCDIRGRLGRIGAVLQDHDVPWIHEQIRIQTRVIDARLGGVEDRRAQMADAYFQRADRKTDKLSFDDPVPAGRESRDRASPRQHLFD